jgi:hypothetical protein
MRTAAALGLLALVSAGCGDQNAGRDPAPAATPAAALPEESASARALRPFAPYEPPAIEPYRNGKRLAARVAQAITTYPLSSTPREVAAAIPGAAGADRLAELIAPAVDRAARSAGHVRYVQLSGVTPRSLGAMVITRQHLQDNGGEVWRVTRVIDVRLRRDGGPWALAAIGSAGGRPVARPVQLPRAAARVLDHPAIELPDSARWDIHAGRVDRQLLAALARAADERRIAVSVLRTGHPPSVWATDRPSAHRRGHAADIYAVDGRLVIRQRGEGSAAHRLAQRFVGSGATQVGSPWLIPPGGKRSFTDAVHQDHLHLQQAPLG